MWLGFFLNRDVIFVVQSIDTILIIDFGSQVTQLIARRLREAQILTRIIPWQHVHPSELQHRDIKGIILSGSAASVLDPKAPKIDVGQLPQSIPVLGICYGMQLLCHAFGGIVRSQHTREFGHATITPTAAELPPPSKDNFLSRWVAKAPQQVWMSHGDDVVTLPENFMALAHSTSGTIAAIADPERGLYGLQFHPEVTHTPDGAALLRAFAATCCGARAHWTVARQKRVLIESIRADVGEQSVLCALSGGVDSTVVAALVAEAIGDRLHCVLVDHGMLRTREAALVQESLPHVAIEVVQAQERFFQALAGVTDPEQKRKHIGQSFISVFEERAQCIPGVTFLAQGTLYPDVIESASTSQTAKTIKSHHNVGGLPERMNLKLIEPLRLLFKDEVRALGTALGLSDAIIGRHPFPGPGLAVRIPGEVTQARCDLLRQVDDIFIQELHAHGLYDHIWQAFAVLLPVASVGVMGDERSYESACVLRAVCSQDGMTADIYNFEMGFLRQTATKIINHVAGVNRVLYDITSKPPATIEWE